VCRCWKSINRNCQSTGIVPTPLVAVTDNAEVALLAKLRITLFPDPIIVATEPEMSPIISNTAYNWNGINDAR